jgi:hypothetical protein
MQLADFTPKSLFDGVQILLEFGEQYNLSIVSHEFSYGGKQGKYEIAVIDAKACEQVNLPGITEEHDTVKGWLTTDDVDAIIKKMYFLTGTTPRQI